jgi:predicted RNase H-like nuclease (RuvC/YqgF family)
MSENLPVGGEAIGRFLRRFPPKRERAGEPTCIPGGGTRRMVESSFSVIEKKISDLAEMVITLKKEKASLAAQLEKKEAEARELARKVEEMNEERESIREKVETILARIESIEL